MTTPGTFSIIGGGRLGRTLGYLIHHTLQLTITDVFCRTSMRAQAAVDFIGAGTPCTNVAALKPADYMLIATCDDAIESCCTKLVEHEKITTETLVFHCSGALSSTLLEPAQQAGACIASLHPIKSFAEPAQAVTDFNGTYCALEGDPTAITRLETLFTALGAQVFSITPEKKILYHAALVNACNHLLPLLQSSVDLLTAAGVPQTTATACLQPLITETTHNFFTLGAERALTGPLARGDHATLQAHHQVLNSHPEAQALYQHLSGLALRFIDHPSKPILDLLTPTDDHSASCPPTNK